MASVYIFWICFALILFLILFFAIKYNMLRDTSILATNKPYSWAKTQFAWWSLIIISCYSTVAICNKILPELGTTALALLGLGAGTLAAATLSDASDQKNAAVNGKSNMLSQNQTSSGFLIDILSDLNGVSIHRLQNFLFNIVFGIWYINAFISNTSKLPDITNTNYIVLLGISSATYAGLKTIENKTT